MAEMKELEGILATAMKMRDQLAQVQEELARQTVEAQAGGGMVTVKASGAQEILSITVEDSVIDPKEKTMLQDLVVAAVNLALARARELARNELAKVAGGLALPPGLLG